MQDPRIHPEWAQREADDIVRHRRRQRVIAGICASAMAGAIVLGICSVAMLIADLRQADATDVETPVAP